MAATQRVPLSRTYSRIYGVVCRVPSGRVVTYGEVARLAGYTGQARLVGYALSALPEHTSLPWHRVVNREGRVSRRAVPGAELSQRILLEAEGVRFDQGGRIALDRFGWRPRRRRETAG